MNWATLLHWMSGLFASTAFVLTLWLLMAVENPETMLVIGGLWLVALLASWLSNACYSRDLKSAEMMLRVRHF